MQPYLGLYVGAGDSQGLVLVEKAFLSMAHPSGSLWFIFSIFKFLFRLLNFYECFACMYVHCEHV